MLPLAMGAILVSRSVTDLTPPANLPLGGYTARGTKVGHPEEPITARTVLLQSSSVKVAIVSYEALTIPDTLADAVKTRIPSDVNLFLVATHTHSAPDSQMLNKRMTLSIPGIANFNRKWLDWTADHIAEGIKAAQSASVESTTELGLLTADSTGLNRNRRKGETPSGQISELFTHSYQTTSPLLMNFAAHATILDETQLGYSGDWPGEFERQTGAAFLPSAIGDVSPAALQGKPAIAPYVTSLEQALTKGQNQSLNPDLQFITTPINLDKPTPHPTFAKEYKVPDALAQMAVNKFALTTANVTAIKIGKLIILGIPGEPTTELGQRIQKQAAWTGDQIWIVSHVNGWIGYILEPEDYDKGGYEATLSLNGRLTANRIAEACKKAVNALEPLPN